jgi:hypothetical protein
VLGASRLGPTGDRSLEVDDVADGHTERHTLTLHDDWFEPPLPEGSANFSPETVSPMTEPVGE